MPRRKLVTADVINQIESWLDAGLSPAAIAEKIGCTLGTLRVRCSQLRISLRRKTRMEKYGGVRSSRVLADLGYERADLQSPRRLLSRRDEQRAARPSRETIERNEQDEHLALWVPQPLLRGLRKRAALKGISEAALAAMLIEAIVVDNLYEAVLDLEETTTGSGKQVTSSG